jgi:hypothetical protein
MHWVRVGSPLLLYSGPCYLCHAPIHQSVLGGLILLTWSVWMSYSPVQWSELDIHMLPVRGGYPVLLYSGPR